MTFLECQSESRKVSRLQRCGIGSDGTEQLTTFREDPDRGSETFSEIQQDQLCHTHTSAGAPCCKQQTYNLGIL